jgi:hypothetical protein
MQLEEIVVGEEGHQTVLKMADVVYSEAIRTPTQIAPEGQDTIFVGGVGPDGGVSKFVINLDEETDVGDDLQQHLFFWEGKIGSMMELEIKTTLNDPISFTEIEGSSDRRSFMAQIDHDTNESTPDISIYLHLMAGLPRLFLDEFLVNQHG